MLQIVYSLSPLHILYIRRSLATVRVSKTKYVVWTQDMNHVAILGKHSKSLNLTYNIKFIYFNISAQSGQQCPLHVYRLFLQSTINDIHLDFIFCRR